MNIVLNNEPVVEKITDDNISPIEEFESKKIE